jgi:hypothetical protein
MLHCAPLIGYKFPVRRTPDATGTIQASHHTPIDESSTKRINFLHATVTSATPQGRPSTLVVDMGKKHEASHYEETLAGGSRRKLRGKKAGKRDDAAQDIVNDPDYYNEQQQQQPAMWRPMRKFWSPWMMASTGNYQFRVLEWENGDAVLDADGKHNTHIQVVKFRHALRDHC